MRLFIAEKPSLGRAIADGLGGGEKKAGYITCNGDIVTWCFGHLINYVDPDEYKREWETWDRQSLPMIPEKWRKEVKTTGYGKNKTVNKSAREQLQTIGTLIQKCSEVVNAGDPDREGQLLVDEVLEYFNYPGPALRIMRLSLRRTSHRKN